MLGLGQGPSQTFGKSSFGKNLERPFVGKDLMLQTNFASNFLEYFQTQQKTIMNAKKSNIF